MTRRTALPLAVVALIALAACSDDSKGTSGTANTSTDSTTPTVSAVEAGKPFPQDRCDANKAAGTIKYLSGFDFAAASSIVDPVFAEAQGYYEALCLDVQLVSGSSTENYAVVADNQAQFASGGSFSEVAEFASGNNADLVAMSVEGRTAIDTLIITDPSVTSIADIEGKKLGVKFALPRSIAAMLASQGLVEGENFETVLLDGFDPTVHATVPGIVGFPGWKSNEPGQLDAAGISHTLIDPADYDVPGSFGVIYSNQQFISEHPTAAEDFMRATMMALADAIADPAAAAEACVTKITENGNPFYLSPEGETARCSVESALVSGAVTAAAPAGVPQLDLLNAEVKAYATLGMFGGAAPAIDAYVSNIAAGLYDADGAVIWPATS